MPAQARAAPCAMGASTTPDVLHSDACRVEVLDVRNVHLLHLETCSVEALDVSIVHLLYLV